MLPNVGGFRCGQTLPQLPLFASRSSKDFKGYPVRYWETAMSTVKIAAEHLRQNLVPELRKIRNKSADGT